MSSADRDDDGLKGAEAIKSVTDGAEVSVDLPDKIYMGTFGRSSGYEVKVQPDVAMLRLRRGGEDWREATVHVHYYLLAGILSELAEGLDSMPPLDEAHRESLQAAAKALAHALRKRR